VKVGPGLTPWRVFGVCFTHFLHTLCLHLSTRKASTSSQKKNAFLDCIEIIVGNGAFAHFEKMIYFLHVFNSHQLQRRSFFRRGLNKMLNAEDLLLDGTLGTLFNLQ